MAITASVGVVLSAASDRGVTTHDLIAHDVIARADTAMYTDKDATRTLGR